MENENQAKAPACPHYWASVHEPGHSLFWITQCMLCHRIDWDDLDMQIRESVTASTFTSPPILEDKAG